MRRSTGWLKHHGLLAFFGLTYAISWASWPAYASGLIPRMEFRPVGPLAAATIVIALAEGRWQLWRWTVGPGATHPGRPPHPTPRSEEK